MAIETTTPTDNLSGSKRSKLAELKVASLPPDVAAKREALLRRLAHLDGTAKKRRGYRTAITLLSKRFLVATQATQIALLQAASFMVDVLEKLPPPI